MYGWGYLYSQSMSERQFHIVTAYHRGKLRLAGTYNHSQRAEGPVWSGALPSTPGASSIHTQYASVL